MTAMGDLSISEATRMIDEANAGGRAISGECHPACLLLPEIGEAEFAELVADIKEHGQRHAIVVDEAGVLLDGRHRWRALQALRLEPRLATFAGTDAEKVALVMSENVHRRHLSTRQRAAVAAELATMARGGDRKSADFKASTGALTDAQAAKVMKVSERSVERAKARMKADPAAHAAAKAGKRPNGVDGDRRKVSKAKPPKAEPVRATGTYTVGSFTHRYTIPAKGDTKLDLAWLRHAPVDGVAKWPRPALGAERVAELAERLAKAV